MCRENPGWGAPHIHGELLKLGVDIGESSVSKYMVRGRKPPSQTWRTFLENHAQQLVSIEQIPPPPAMVARRSSAEHCGASAQLDESDPQRHSALTPVSRNLTD
jgi:hypothetical protein